VVDEQDRGLAHAPAHARRAHAATLARERDPQRVAAALALRGVDAGLVTGCSSVPITGLPTELLALLVSTGYVLGRDALSATDAIARGLPTRLLSSGARRACELVSVIEHEVERQRGERNGEVEDGHDA
jgi:hypothetical protein